MIFFQPDKAECPYAIEIEHSYDYEHRFYVTIYHEELRFGRSVLPEIASGKHDVVCYVIRYELHRLLKRRCMTMMAYKQLNDIICDMMCVSSVEVFNAIRPKRG